MKSKIFRIVIAFGIIPQYPGEPKSIIAIDVHLKQAQAILHKAQNTFGKIHGEIHLFDGKGLIGLYGAHNFARLHRRSIHVQPTISDL